MPGHHPTVNPHGKCWIDGFGFMKEGKRLRNGHEKWKGSRAVALNLADYTKEIRAALKRGAYACVYVVANAQPPRCRVSYGEDLSGTFSRLQRTSPAALTVESVLWGPSRAIATNIANAANCDLLAPPGKWIAAAAETATQAVEIAAFRLYDGDSWYDQLLAQFRSVRST